MHISPAGDHPDALFDAIAWNVLAHEPERATALGVDHGERGPLRAKLKVSSPAGQQAYAETLRAGLARVRSIDRASAGATTRTTCEVVESAFATALDGFALPYGDVAVGSWRNAPYVVIQNVGGYIDLPRFLDSKHPIRNAEPQQAAANAEAYLARLEQFPALLDGELERIREAAGLGVTPPAFALVRAIAQIEASARDAKSGGALVETLVRKLAEAGLAGDWADRARALAAGPIAAALERQAAELRRQLALAGDAPGMWAQPRGDEWYAWVLRAATTTRLTPDEIHAMGLEQLDEIHARMDPILRDLGYTRGTVGARMAALGGDPRFRFSEGDPGRAEIMAFIGERLAWIRAQMPRAFQTVPDLELEVRRLPMAEEPGAPLAYAGKGSKDGAIPGRMWINLHTTDLHLRYTIPTLVHHEMVPGHLWEGEFSNQLPLIRSLLSFSASTEGWALYAEQLADELGAYAENPAWRLGYLQDQAFRAARMVVDTGLHHKRWTRRQAVDFFVTRNGDNPADIESEVDRYCTWPGQACGYKLGHTEFVSQRARAQAALGDRFDLRSFNDALLVGGNAPLEVLAKTVDRHLAAARG